MSSPSSTNAVPSYKFSKVFREEIDDLRERRSRAARENASSDRELVPGDPKQRTLLILLREGLERHDKKGPSAPQWDDWAKLDAAERLRQGEVFWKQFPPLERFRVLLCKTWDNPPDAGFVGEELQALWGGLEEKQRRILLLEGLDCLLKEDLLRLAAEGYGLVSRDGEPRAPDRLSSLSKQEAKEAYGWLWVVAADEGRLELLRAAWEKFPEDERLRQLRRETLDMNLVGLALSGGGIRSATFNLGVFQALAELGLLRKIDYLSTVSGGGFIGGWLAAWIQRDCKLGGGAANVAQQLHPNHKEQAKANRPKIPDGQVRDDEPKEIHHLREYSNYLAPRPGLFSNDGWTVIAIFFRNLLLNQLVLFFAILALLFGMAWVVKGFAVFDKPLAQSRTTSGLVGPAWGFLAGLALVVLALVFARWILDRVVRRVRLAYLRKHRQGGGSGLAAARKKPRARRQPAPPRSDQGKTIPRRQRRLLVAGLLLLGWLLLAGSIPIANLFLPGLPEFNNRARSPLFQLLTPERLLLAAFLLALLVAGFSIYAAVPLVGRALRGAPPAAELERARRDLQMWILFPLLVAAVTGSWFSGLVLHRLPPFRLAFKDAFEVMLVFGLAHSAFNWRSYLGWFRRPRPKKQGRWLTSGWLAGAIGGLLLYVLGTQLHELTTPEHTPTEFSLHIASMATLGPPLLLLVFVLTSFVQVGVLGKEMKEPQREWWASLGGWVLFYAASWVLLFGTFTFGPYLLLSLQGEDGWGWIRQAGLALAWVLSVASSLAAAKSPRTRPGSSPANSRTRLLEAAARVGPALFFLGLLVPLSLLTVTLIHTKWPEDPGNYLEQLSYHKLPQFVRPIEDWLLGFTSEAHQEFLRKLIDGWSWWITPAILMLCAAASFGLAYFLGWWIDINLFSLHGLYANRITRCYLGASRGRARRPHPVTGFDPEDDLKLANLAASSRDNCRGYDGPLLLINATLNLVGGLDLAWQERRAEPFMMTARYCGSRATDYRRSKEFAGNLSLGTVLSISGAAVSPNMGYYSAPAVTALLTLFNARLGVWLGNPNCPGTWRSGRPPSGLIYILREMFGRTDAESDYVYLSDGGHFENLGVYELIRRRCRFIILSDAGADPNFTLENLGNLIRKVRIDFGVRIELDVSPLRPQGPNSLSASHIAIGKIQYGDVDGTNGPPPKYSRNPHSHLRPDEGLLVYIKPSFTGDEPTDLQNYAAQNPTFPHQSTLNQFFSESQFESYRALGYHCVKNAFEGITPPDHKKEELFQWLYGHWFPPPTDYLVSSLQGNREYVQIHEALRSDERLIYLCAEIYPDVVSNTSDSSQARKAPEVLIAERHMVAQMMAVLENAFLSLNLEEHTRHPIYEGWMAVFQRWMRSPIIRSNWEELSDEFSQEIRDFIEKNWPQHDKQK
jgi:hypothetical protein